MKNSETHAITANIQRMIQSSLEVIEKCKTAIDANSNVIQNKIMLNYERGMIRGLERSLSMVEEIDAVVADHEAKGGK